MDVEIESRKQYQRDSKVFYLIVKQASSFFLLLPLGTIKVAFNLLLINKQAMGAGQVFLVCRPTTPLSVRNT